MAKGLVRKKGKKWYGRFYIEDESGRKVQKEFAGTERKAETEAMLCKARFIACKGQRKFRRTTRNSPLSALEQIGRMKRRVR